MTDMRLQILSDTKLSQCVNCYKVEQHTNDSHRIRENYKSAIFPDKQFDKSFLQSPGNNWFVESENNNGITSKMPVDWHIDFGNECNLACKMCKPLASSRIANYFKTWEISNDDGWFRTTGDLSSNWTVDPVKWGNFLSSVDQISDINRIHIMGGEPMMSKKFKEFVEYLIDQNRSEISLSFVTNGTFYDEEFFKKLNFFRTVDIELSIETFDNTNDYIRQGSDINTLKDNINKILSLRNDKISLVLRPAPQLLSVNSYHAYLQFALDNQVAVSSNLLLRPEFMQISVLPRDLKESLVDNYTTFIKNANSEVKINSIAIGRDTSRLSQILIAEAEMIISNLRGTEPTNVESLRKELIQWLLRWDKEFNFNAMDYYPEYTEFFKTYGYSI
jgi:organic radical activating enzyme